MAAGSGTRDEILEVVGKLILLLDVAVLNGRPIPRSTQEGLDG
ncbi:hypothetical protein ACX40Y_04310 [Sphingomonas sp. RS6]